VQIRIFRRSFILGTFCRTRHSEASVVAKESYVELESSRISVDKRRRNCL